MRLITEISERATHIGTCEDVKCLEDDLDRIDGILSLLKPIIAKKDDLLAVAIKASVNHALDNAAINIEKRGERVDFRNPSNKRSYDNVRKFMRDISRMIGSIRSVELEMETSGDAEFALAEHNQMVEHREKLRVLMEEQENTEEDLERALEESRRAYEAFQNAEEEAVLLERQREELRDEEEELRRAIENSISELANLAFSHHLYYNPPK